MSQRSDTSKSTSGCSSMVPQQESGRRDSGPGVEKRKAVDQENYGTQPSSRSPDQQPTVKRQRCKCYTCDKNNPLPHNAAF